MRSMCSEKYCCASKRCQSEILMKGLMDILCCVKLLLTKSAQELSASCANQNSAAKKRWAGGMCCVGMDHGGFGYRDGRGPAGWQQAEEIWCNFYGMWKLMLDLWLFLFFWQGVWNCDEVKRSGQRPSEVMKSCGRFWRLWGLSKPFCLPSGPAALAQCKSYIAFWKFLSFSLKSPYMQISIEEAL